MTASEYVIELTSAAGKDADNKTFISFSIIYRDFKKYIMTE